MPAWHGASTVGGGDDALLGDGRRANSFRINQTQLDRCPPVIVKIPLFCSFAIRDAPKSKLSDPKPAALGWNGGGQRRNRRDLTALRSARVEAGYYEITFGGYVLHLLAPVWKGSAPGKKTFLEFRQAPRVTGPIVLHEVGGKELIRRLSRAAVVRSTPNLLVDAPNDCFVPFQTAVVSVQSSLVPDADAQDCACSHRDQRSSILHDHFSWHVTLSRCAACDSADGF